MQFKKWEDVVEDQTDIDCEVQRKSNLLQIKNMGEAVPEFEQGQYSQIGKISHSQVNYSDANNRQPNPATDYLYFDENVASMNHELHQLPREYLKEPFVIDPTQFQYEEEQQVLNVFSPTQRDIVTPQMGTPRSLITPVPITDKPTISPLPADVLHSLNGSPDISFVKRHSEASAIKGKTQVFFFYDLIPKSNKSSLLPEHTHVDPKFLFLKQTVIPFGLVILLYFAISRIQRVVNDFCFVADICQCKSTSVRFWSFFRQLVAYKIGLIAYKKVIISEIIKTKYQTNRTPHVEMTLLYFLIIFCDGLSVMWLEMNMEYHFLIINYVIGLIILVNIMKAKNIGEAIVEGRGLIMYDLAYFVLFSFVFYGLPSIYSSLIESSSYTLGRSQYYSVYPLIDWLLEWIYDIMLANSSNGYLFLSQIELIIIGVRLGTILIYTWSDFQFWYLVILIYIRKLNSMTLIVTIFFRKRLFQCVPHRFKCLFSMGEVSLAERARNGGTLEHQFWIFIYFALHYNKDFMIPQIRDTVVIRNCAFHGKNYLEDVDWPSFILLYILSSLCILFAVFLNSGTRYDNIKWLAGQNFTLFENVITRMTGYYFFQSAFLFSFLIQSYSSTTVTSKEYS